MHRARPRWGIAALWSSAARSRRYWRTVGQLEGIVSEQDTDHHFVHRSTIPTMHFQPSLPRLPIPKLEDTINRYLAAQKPLLNEEEYRNTEKIARKFEAGEGRLIHRDLLEHDRLNKHTSYIAGPWYDMYLSARDPIVLNYNPFITLNPDPKPEYNRQIVRATNLVVSSLKFLNSLKNNYLRPDIYYVNRKWGQSKVFKHFIRILPPSISWYGAYLVNAYPLDMSQYKSLFNSTRIPNLSKDALFTSEFARHLLVMRNGHLYVFEVLDAFGNILHPSEILAHLTQIIHDADRLPKFELCYLTTEDRNTWATLRQELVQKGNEENLKKIDSAVFCLCLDRASPQNELELTHCFLHGYGFNRWFDKSFSLIVTSDGTAGINFEHSWGDGIAILRFINEVYRDSTEHPALVPQASPALFVTSCDKLEFNMDHTITSAISAARQKFDQKRGMFCVKTLKYKKFGKQYLINQNLSPDAVFQLACQMAVYHQYGKLLPSYEACSTAAFKHGRTETIRPTSVYTKKCTVAFIDQRGKHSTEDMRNMIDECSKYHRRLQLEATLGQGFDRHLFALKYLVQRRGGRMPDIYNDPAYKNINHIIISTSTLGSEAINHGGFGPVVPDGFGVGYNMFEDWVGSIITSYLEKDSEELIKYLEYTLNDIYDVLEGRSLK
ncbi:carnitine O-palmitoyltransferase 2, mitochondrial-like [Podarcis muralis]|uniref:carnitine O-palmitoyltransferase 2, mitochondrial-like isoform X1 n=2 Tax=Podarcis muralis TaxID=64176 RepID=UPI0010A0526E|nr:carnitine O-palmitoyltransferase 2, mitochondrial-like isoform X1 [Podarcis muralis]